MRLTIVPSDKFIAIDGNGFLDIQQDFSWIPSNVHAVQWYDTWGEVEYNDGTPNERIEELGVFSQAETTLNAEKARIQAELDAKEAARDYAEELRLLRNQRLFLSDWSQLADNSLTTAQKTAWTTYRQELRDLPETVTDPKPLVQDPNHKDWPTPPAS
jgi:uncharacterized small protein (DUF1192 family)